jgi:hypothetical protein
MRKTWTIGAVALLAGILMMPNYQAVARGGGGFHGGGFHSGALVLIGLVVVTCGQGAGRNRNEIVTRPTLN